MKINYKTMVEDLSRESPDDRRRAMTGVREAFVSDARLRDNFSLAKLFIDAFGWHEFQRCREDRDRTGNSVMEAAGPVTTAAFTAITQQFAYSTYIAAFEYPDRVFAPLIPHEPSQLRTERIPGITNIGDEVQTVEENQEYPLVGVGENYIETPETRKRGAMVAASWEALFFDRTGQLRDRLAQVGKADGLNDEKRAIACIVDSGETAKNQYRYRWLGNTIATYGANSGTHTWANLVTTNAFTDYTNLNASFLAFMALTDPFTGEPIGVTPKDLIVPPALLANVPFVTGGMVRRAVPGFATSGTPTVTQADNPMQKIMGNLRPLSSQLLKNATSSDTTWFLGDIAGAFGYKENLPTEVMTAPAGSEAEVTRDTVLRIRVRRMGTYYTREPRLMQKNTA